MPIDRSDLKTPAVVSFALTLMGGGMLLQAAAKYADGTDDSFQTGARSVVGLACLGAGYAVAGLVDHENANRDFIDAVYTDVEP